jgi:hypothetical protein
VRSASELRLIVAIDTSQETTDGSQNGHSSARLLEIALDDNKTWNPTALSFSDTASDDQDAARISREGLRQALYILENLRKTDFGDDAQSRD